MAIVHHRVGIAAPAERIFECLVTPQDLTGWWASSAEANANPDGDLNLGFLELTTLNFKIINIQPAVTLKVCCTGEPELWIDSILEFKLEKAANQTLLYLTHSKEAASQLDFLYFNTKWPLFLVSLKNYIETGRGQPYPNDVRIDHC